MLEPSMGILVPIGYSFWGIMLEPLGVSLHPRDTLFWVLCWNLQGILARVPYSIQGVMLEPFGGIFVPMGYSIRGIMLEPSGVFLHLRATSFVSI